MEFAGLSTVTAELVGEIAKLTMLTAQQQQDLAQAKARADAAERERDEALALLPDEVRAAWRDRRAESSASAPIVLVPAQAEAAGGVEGGG